jgi:hypothetical protein
MKYYVGEERGHRTRRAKIALFLNKLLNRTETQLKPMGPPSLL